MFSLFIMPKRRTFGHFLASSENILFFVKKENVSSKRRTYGKPTVRWHFTFRSVFSLSSVIQLRWPGGMERLSLEL